MSYYEISIDFLPFINSIDRSINYFSIAFSCLLFYPLHNHFFDFLFSHLLSSLAFFLSIFLQSFPFVWFVWRKIFIFLMMLLVYFNVCLWLQFFTICLMHMLSLRRENVCYVCWRERKVIENVEIWVHLFSSTFIFLSSFLYNTNCIHSQKKGRWKRNDGWFERQ